jgi:hypothetical protein
MQGALFTYVVHFTLVLVQLRHVAVGSEALLYAQQSYGNVFAHTKQQHGVYSVCTMLHRELHTTLHIQFSTIQTDDFTTTETRTVCYTQTAH